MLQMAGKAILEVSIRAPLAGGDHHGPIIREDDRLFQSAPPSRGATWSKVTD